MITEMTKDKVIELGARNKAGYLLEQAGYTLALAGLDGEPLAELLDNGYLEELRDTVERVRDALKDRTLAGEESKGSTQAVNAAMREAKLWRRAVNHRAERADKMGKQVPDVLLSTDGVKGVPGVATQVDKMVKLLEAGAALFSQAGLPALIAQGKGLVDSLKAVDAAQEVKRLKQLPDKVRDFYHQKGLLFIGIKVVNSAGRELHVHDPSAASKYNLSILNRHSGRKKVAAAARA